VLDLLSRLVEKSLVVVTERAEEARYRLLETVRQYAAEKLRGSGEEPEIRRRHAGYYLGLTVEAELKINTADRLRCLERLEAEHDNLRAALRWTTNTAGEAQTGLRLSGALLWFWFHRGYWREGRGWFRETLAGATTPTAERAKALYGAGSLAWTAGDHAAARPLLEESAALWRKLGDGRGLAHSLGFLSMEVLGRGEPAAARSLSEESVAILREGEDAFGLALSLALLGKTRNHHRSEDHHSVKDNKQCVRICCRDSRRIRPSRRSRTSSGSGAGPSTPRPAPPRARRTRASAFARASSSGMRPAPRRSSILGLLLIPLPSPGSATSSTSSPFAAHRVNAVSRLRLEVRSVRRGGFPLPRE
jgi:hypothetical protein